MAPSTGPSAKPTGAEKQPEGVERLRTRHQVRLVCAEEEGLEMQFLPSGVYGFTHAPAQNQIPLFARKGYRSFEMHKAAGGKEYILGFVTSQEAAALEAGAGEAAIQLFPDPRGESQCLVAVPLSRISPLRRRLPRDDGNPFEFTTS